MLVDLVGQDLPALHLNDAVGHGCQGCVVGDDDDGAARLAAGALQQGQHLFAGLVVQRTGRLIAEQELRIFGEGARNGDALLFAAGKLGREVVQPLAEPTLSSVALGSSGSRQISLASSTFSSAVRFCTRL